MIPEAAPPPNAPESCPKRHTAGLHPVMPSHAHQTVGTVQSCQCYKVDHAAKGIRSRLAGRVSTENRQHV